MEKTIKANDFVWAKMTGFPPWPSIVLEPGADIPEKPLRKDSDIDFYWVYFFGSHNYAWVEEFHLKPYLEYRDKFMTMYKTTLFKDAVAEIENILKELENDSNYQIEFEPFKKKEKKIKRTKERTFHNNVLKKRPKIIKNEENSSESELSVTSMSTEERLPHNVSREVLKTKNLTTSDLTFGVLGIGIIGSGVVKNLIRSGHKVNIWNRTSRKCTELENQLSSSELEHLQTCITPRAVMRNSDIVFNCLSDHNVSKRIIQSYFGINNSSDDILNNKGFVEMTGIDPETSKDIRDMIEKKGARYLEAQVQGSKNEAADGTLTILTAGNRSLFFDCQSCFKAMGQSAIFLGDVGYATKVNLIIQLIKGVCLVGLTEGMAFAERCGVSSEQFISIFNETNLDADFLKGKAAIIAKKNFSNVEQSLKNMQKDMKLGLEMSDRFGQPMQLASIAHEVFKHCRRFELCNQDSSAIYLRTKF